MYLIVKFGYMSWDMFNLLEVFRIYVVHILNDLQVILMLMTILSVFAVCWLPLQVSILYSEHRSDKSEVNINGLLNKVLTCAL